MSLDSTFGTAEWWFSNSWRWLLQGRPAPDVDLPALLEARGPDLPELDRWLIEAQKDTTETGRMAAYKKTVEHYPHDAYAQFLYADEMLTRGALIGIPLDSAILELELAASMDSTFGPAHLDLVWSYLRLGPRDSAEASLRRYQSVYAAEEGVTVTDTIWYDILIQERFELGSAQEQLTDMLADSPIMRDTLLSYFRLLGIWDMALFQASLSEIVLDDAAAIEPGMRAHLHEGLGLALIGLGRISQGLQHIDSAATLLDIDSARLEAAEWRVVAPALGLPGVAEAEIERGRTVLYQLLSEPNSRARAAWALGVDAAHRGDTVATQVWIDTLQAIPSDTSAERLAVLLRAIDRGAQGDWQVALDSSHSALQFDSAGRGGDPFARATLHMKRAQWHDSLGHPHEADAARMWYEHFEFLGSPQGEAQASEVDWALSPLARMQRGRAAAVRGRDTLWSRLIQLLPWIKGNREHRTKACSFFSRLAELWIDADPAYDSFKTEIEDYLERRCR